jgi:hypothetical protein
VSATGKTKRRCENCVHWSSTDQIWGDCTLISVPDRGQDREAVAQYVAAPGEVEDGEFWSKWSFGCSLWQSLAAAIKRVGSGQ